VAASIDLSKAWKTRTHGDLVAVYSWLNDERALFLIPLYRQKAPWFVVMESAAWSWDDEDPKNVANVAGKAMKACEVLGIEPTAQNARRIAGIVIDGLPDLIRMPTSPEKEMHKTGFGEMHLKANGETIASDLIRVEKETGATYG
jgi:hypothetical protein